MASIIPFNNATINSVPVATSEMVHGSCNYVKNGQDVATTTSDGRIHNDRIVITKETCKNNLKYNAMRDKLLSWLSQKEI